MLISVALLMSSSGRWDESEYDVSKARPARKAVSRSGYFTREPMRMNTDCPI